jgi:hypothetical protein
MNNKDTLFFITPVFERYALTAICLKQRLHACEQLEREGINATCVVIGDDANLDAARDLGFPVVEQNNQYLGRKFNDGHEYAAKHGATYVAPVGSDSWMDPTWIIGRLPRTRALLVSKHYAMVHKTGMKRAQLHIPYVSYVVPVNLLATSKFRPILETRLKGCDTNTMASLELDGKGPVRKLISNTSHMLDTVAFQSPTQITDYNRIYGRWGVSEVYDAFVGLDQHYPASLVSEMENFYAVDNTQTSYQLLDQVIPFLKRSPSATSRDLILAIEGCLAKRERELAGDGTIKPKHSDT